MSASGAPTPEQLALPPGGLSVALIAAQWHAPVISELLVGAYRALSDCSVQLIRVPGALELPVAAARCAPHVSAIVALGVVIRGGTPHFDYVCQAATMGLVEVSLRTGVPVGCGVLTCDTMAQAFARSGGPTAQEDKGFDAATAALATALALTGLPGIAPTQGHE